MSFTDQPADQATPNVPADQPLTFNVGERTFDTDSAITKIQAADEHIARLEAENAEYKSKVEQSTSIDEALAQLREKNAAPQNSQPTPDTTGVSEEQIGAIANKQIAEFLAAKQVEEHASAAEALAKRTYMETGEQLKAIYGDKTDEAIATKAAELGVPSKELFDMATNPTTAKLLLQTMKANPAPSQPTPSGGYNSAHVSSQQSESFIDYSKPITSSTITAALKQAGGGYN